MKTQRCNVRVMQEFQEMQTVRQTIGVRRRKKLASYLLPFPLRTRTSVGHHVLPLRLEYGKRRAVHKWYSRVVNDGTIHCWSSNRGTSRVKAGQTIIERPVKTAHMRCKGFSAHRRALADIGNWKVTARRDTVVTEESHGPRAASVSRSFAQAQEHVHRAFKLSERFLRSELVVPTIFLTEPRGSLHVTFTCASTWCMNQSDIKWRLHLSSINSSLIVSVQ